MHCCEVARRILCVSEELFSKCDGGVMVSIVAFQAVDPVSMDKFVIRNKKVLKSEEPSTSSDSQLSTGEQIQPENDIPTNSVTEQKGRHFQSKWRANFPWLLYDKDIDKVFCEICKEAMSSGVSLPKKSSRDEKSIKTFTQSGFSSWNKAIKNKNKTNLERGVNVHSMLSKSKLEDMKTARIALLKMISTLRFLMTGGLAIRGDEDEHSNYIRLLNLRSEDIPELKAWLQRSKYKWLSHDVTNELSSILSHEILRKIIKLVQNAVYYSVMIDETSDITNHEQKIWKSTVDLAHILKLDEPKTPKIRMRPKRIDESSSEPHQFSSPADYYRKMYFEVLDKAVGCIEERFTRNAMTHLSNIEQFLTKQNDKSSSYLKEFYGDDFDVDRLVLHRNMLLDIAQTKHVTLNNVEDIVSFIISHCGSVKHMISEIIKLLKIIMTIPISTCTAERSFSALRRIKTYLRSTMTQQRLNDHMIVHSFRGQQNLDSDTILFGFRAFSRHWIVSNSLIFDR
nr:unnamed protein product [Callosobruchus chinensis]